MSWFDVNDFNKYKQWGSSVGRVQHYVIYARMYAPDALEEATRYLRMHSPSVVIWDLLEEYNNRFKEIIWNVYGIDLDNINVERFILFAIRTNLIVADWLRGEKLPPYAKKRLYLLGARILGILNGFGEEYTY